MCIKLWCMLQHIIDLWEDRSAGEVLELFRSFTFILIVWTNEPLSSIVFRSSDTDLYVSFYLINQTLLLRVHMYVFMYCSAYIALSQIPSPSIWSDCKVGPFYIILRVQVGWISCNNILAASLIRGNRRRSGSSQRRVSHNAPGLMLGVDATGWRRSRGGSTHAAGRLFMCRNKVIAWSLFDDEVALLL